MLYFAAAGKRRSPGGGTDTTCAEPVGRVTRSEQRKKKPSIHFLS